MKQFIDELKEGEISARLMLEREKVRLSKSEIYDSANAITIALDKLVELLGDDEVKVCIKNMYYHAGRIKGLVS